MIEDPRHLTPFAHLATGRRPQIVPDPTTESIALQVKLMLAEESPFTITQRRLDQVIAPYDLRKPERVTVASLVWGGALEIFLADEALSEGEATYLGRLAYLLDLGFDDIDAVFRRIVHPRLRKVVSEILADGKVTADEREGLARLRSQLQVERYALPIDDEFTEL